MSEAKIPDDVAQHVLSVSVDKATLAEEQRIAHDIYVHHCVDSAYVCGCVLVWGMGGGMESHMSSMQLLLHCMDLVKIYC